ncbi:monofunctional biosynthetic peptidoglycan transglycosylase [Algihabitans albus]|uniref:monofunctional biosynthetic peptidoglycan transglycosylase n=1 Tax=Algihabitans albus TaxID=2164067 RepID=UPI000E5CE79F|nr:monofunctional biosynthetic peptidoglycan transglycosylase [Algihabitans albus]
MRRLWKALRWLAVLVVLLPAGLVLFYRAVPPPATPLMVIRSFEGHGWQRDWVPLAEIAQPLREAVLAAEDNRFCTHWGFDLVELRKAVDTWRDGGRLRGASTVSMQTAKNLFLWPERDWLRKGLEGYLTLYLEVLLPKARIVELYLNSVEFGPGIYGAEAAAQAHFGKSASDLSLWEASLLAAVLPNPLQRSAGRPDDFLAGQAARIRTRIDQLGPMLDCVR